MCKTIEKQIMQICSQSGIIKINKIKKDNIKNNFYKTLIIFVYFNMYYKDKKLTLYDII